jgi:hypothetical protein
MNEEQELGLREKGIDSKTYLAHIKAERARRDAQPWYIKIPVNVGEYLWYRVIRRIPEIPDEIKWKWQTLTKGYCDCDLWGLDHFIVEKIRAPLKEFIRYQEERGHGVPTDFANDSAGWLAVLKKIEFAFDESYAEEHDYRIWYGEGMTHEQVMERYKKVQEGFELFGKYFSDLWD